MKHWYDSVVSEDDRRVIEAAVVRAEQTTSAEIVPMIVRRSSSAVDVWRALLWGALLGLIFGYVLESKLPHAAPYFAVGGVILAALALQVPAFARALLSYRERQEAAETRAELEFYRQKIASTKDGIGVLILVSHFERQVVVLADQSISKVLPPSTWNDACSKVIKGLKQRSFGTSMADAITDIGSLCAPHFPVKDANPNELSDRLIVKD